MIYFKLSVVLLLLIATPALALEEVRDLESGAGAEYCITTENFEASCLKNEIILMTSASYGRMRIGRCLASEGDVTKYGHDPLFLGCSVDVLAIFDSRCSAKNQCAAKLVDEPELQKLQPCHPFLKNYLQAAYSCISVVDEDRTCTVMVTSRNQYIIPSSSTSSAEKNCGDETRPWKIEAESGQKIAVTMINFKEYDIKSDVKSDCEVFAIVHEQTRLRNISNCAVGDERIQDKLTSTSNSIQLTLFRGRPDPGIRTASVILGFRAVGCRNIVPPEDTWLRRNENKAVIGCYSSHQTWRLNCVANQWQGVIGNCTRETVTSLKQIYRDENKVDNQVLVIVTIVVIGMIVCTIIIVSAVICMKRYSLSKIPKQCKSPYAENFFPNYSDNQLQQQKNLIGSKTLAA